MQAAVLTDIWCFGTRMLKSGIKSRKEHPILHGMPTSQRRIMGMSSTFRGRHIRPFRHRLIAPFWPLHLFLDGNSIVKDSRSFNHLYWRCLSNQVSSVCPKSSVTQCLNHTENREKIMCDVKKLCTCDAVREGQDHWRLEFCYGHFPSWEKLVKTRPEHRKLAEKARDAGASILGPMPMPLFRELHHGIAEPEHLERVIKAEENWLNEINQFDFAYEPFEGDRLMFFVGGEKIAFSFVEGRWKHKPHQAYSVDHRRRVDANAEDRAARERAASYFQSRYKSGD